MYRYALVLVVVLSGCSTTGMMQRNLAACENMGYAGKEASECALRILEASSRGGTVRVVK
jgi:hypothetical protein